MSDKKKIAFLVNSLGRGGAERVISRLSSYMKDYYDFCIIIFDSHTIAYDVDAEIVSLGTGEHTSRVLYLFEIISKGKKFQKEIAKRNIQCVVSFLVVPDLINILFNKTAKRLINIRVDLDQDLSYGVSSKIKHIIKKFLYKKADGAIVLSEKTKEQLINEYEFKNPIQTIYNPFDLKKIEEAVLSSEKYPGFTVVAMGRLDIQKGFIHLIRSIRYILDTIPDFKLIIMGDGGLRQTLQKEAQLCGIQDNICFMGNVDNPFSIIAKADLFVLSSLFEGFPNALVEAMSCGVPVISTDCETGPREILYNIPDMSVRAVGVECADYGVIVPSFNNKDTDSELDKKYHLLADAIKMMIDNKDMRIEYAHKAKERAQYYSTEKCVKNYIEFIDSYL